MIMIIKQCRLNCHSTSQTYRQTSYGGRHRRTQLGTSQKLVSTPFKLCRLVYVTKLLFFINLKIVVFSSLFHAIRRIYF